jgi:hypothetical protein
MSEPSGLRNFSSSSGVEIFTLHDLVHRLALRSSSNQTPRMNALFVRAIQDAIRGLPSKHDWNYFRRQVRLKTSPRAGLSVTYDHTGGAHERLLTVTDGVLPADAMFGEIRIGNTTYRILNRISDTEATLEDNFSLSEDFTGNCTWERRAYRFSREVVKVHYLHNISRNSPITLLSTQEFASLTHNGWGYGQVTHYTFQNHGGWFGESEFVLLPSPTVSETIEASVTVTPLVPHINEVSGSGAEATSGSFSVSVPGAEFSNRLIGCIFRLGRDAVQPINLDSSNWDFQAFVVGVPDSETLLLSEAAPETTVRGYCISSPIDVESSAMLEYVEDEAYHQYTKNHDHKSFQIARRVAGDSLRMAVARDNKTSLNGHMRQESFGYMSGRFYTQADAVD